jgi:hypothetical protein
MKVLKTVGKLGLTGAIIVGIGFFAFTQDPDSSVGEVAPAEADIGWFDVGSDGHEFTRAIAVAGMEPRPYDLNGNRMWFASGRTELKPNQVEDTMQDIFVEQGVNEDNHAGIKPMEQMALNADNFTTDRGKENLARAGGDNARLLMDGEVIPIQRKPGYVAMAGYDWRMSDEEMIEQMESGKADSSLFNPDYMMKGYKFLDATWEPESRMTSITSVWTDDKFDSKKMRNESFKEQEPDPNIPACMGCERDFRFQSLAKNEPYRANHWNTQMTPSDTYGFYQRAMASRGWKASNSQAMLDKVSAKLPTVGAINGRMLNLEKDGKSMVIALLPNGEGGTEVMSTERYTGATSVLNAVDERAARENKRDSWFDLD